MRYSFPEESDFPITFFTILLLLPKIFIFQKHTLPHKREEVLI